MIVIAVNINMTINRANITIIVTMINLAASTSKILPIGQKTTAHDQVPYMNRRCY